jgi:hypothetical protein
MKRCPTCTKVLPDDAMLVCPYDGTPLLDTQISPSALADTLKGESSIAPSATAADLKTPDGKNIKWPLITVGLLLIIGLILTMYIINRSNNSSLQANTNQNKIESKTPANNSNAQSPSNVSPSFVATPAASMSPTPAANSSPQVQSFSAYVGDNKGKRKFIDFLTKNERKIVSIDIVLSDEQMANVRNSSEGKNMLFVDLNYQGESPSGGELYIDLSKGEKDFSLGQREQRMQSYLKIVVVQMQQGIFLINAVPVSIESVR